MHKQFMYLKTDTIQIINYKLRPIVHHKINVNIKKGGINFKCNTHFKMQTSQYNMITTGIIFFLNAVRENIVKSK